MDASEVIDSYVHDVARRLPPGKRNDVALELRALLADELGARADAEGRPADADMAVAMLRGFGRPAEAAVRYYRPFTIIEPSDTWGFLVATIAGGSVISLLASPGPGDTYNERAQQATVAFLGWLGVLVIAFAVKNLILRRRPDAFAWVPRPVRVRDRASRVGGVGLALLWAALLVLYLAPGRVVGALSSGRIAARTLAYTDSFTGPLRMPWLVGVLVLAIGLHLLVAAQGRWRPATRWARIALTALIGSQLGWHARYGSIFSDPDVDRHLIPVIAAMSGLILAVCGIELYREYNRIRPAQAPAPVSTPAPTNGPAM
ncbi:MAG TPA: hypothetical protein VMU51_24590 [Mycobacteriales bacterium]|nr:hypothetical protein [Mycobacteriales bacterium]